MTTLRKLSILATSLLFSHSMLHADITIKQGWQLLGATQDLNTTIFDKDCIDYVWKYDANNTDWQVHMANEETSDFTAITSFAKGEGYWVLGNGDCNITVATISDTIMHKDIIYGTVTSSTGEVWLDRNLGASRACTALDDTACYGDYYQWGRDVDGHQYIASETTGTQATAIIASNSSFVTGSFDWTTADSDGALRSAAWSKTDGTSICPVGYRVPTIGELIAEIDAGISDRDKAYSKLKLPSAGYRNYSDGSMIARGTDGFVWSSSVDGTSSDRLHFLSTNAYPGSSYHARGYSVRCIKD